MDGYGDWGGVGYVRDIYTITKIRPTLIERIFIILQISFDKFD
ncbi:hypothetical protein [Moraxella lacunata]